MSHRRGLLMFNMSYRSDWERGMVNRNYHVLEALRKRGDFDVILSVDFLPFSLKKKLKVLIEQRPFQRNAHTVYKSFSTRVDRDANDAHLYHMTATSDAHLQDVLRAIDFPEDALAWSYSPFTADILERLPQEVPVVFDAVDNWIEHPAYTAYTAQLEGLYKRISDRADVIFTVSEGLVEFFGKKEHVVYVPNGVDVKHFAGGACHTLFGNDDEGNKQPVIGYHGIIQSRVNIAVFAYLAEHHPEYQFVLIGPVWDDVRAEVNALSQEHDNVTVLGSVPYPELPNYIACFDAAIVPHKVDRFTQSMNPLKLYEYLAARKPIISTAVAGADQFGELVQLAVSPEDFSTQIQQALTDDSDALRTKRYELAQLHSWEKRMDVMHDVLERALADREGSDQ